MEAKIADSYRWKTARLCGGAEFIKGEFRPVPAGREDEARNVEFLVIQDTPPAPPVPPQETVDTQGTPDTLGAPEGVGRKKAPVKNPNRGKGAPYANRTD